MIKYLLLLAFASTSVFAQQVITVSNGEIDGDWGPLDSCPSGHKAVSYQIQAELVDLPGDDTGVNSVILFCDDADFTNITSTEGLKGNLQAVQNCPLGGYLVAFQLRVNPNGNYTDDTAVNNIRFRCSNGREIGSVGGQLGSWGDWSGDCSAGICGIETRVRPDGGLLVDDTAMNDVRFTCCGAAVNDDEKRFNV